MRKCSPNTSRTSAAGNPAEIDSFTFTREAAAAGLMAPVRGGQLGTDGRGGGLAWLGIHCLHEQSQ